jgi:hypothetical protein
VTATHNALANGKATPRSGLFSGMKVRELSEYLVPRFRRDTDAALARMTFAAIC